MTSVIIVGLCSVGASFHVGFFIALCKQGQRRWICHVLQLHPEADEYAMSELEFAPDSLPRVA